MGGAIFNFSQKTTSKPPKRCDFAYFTSQWEARDPRPLWLRYCLTVSFWPSLVFARYQFFSHNMQYDCFHCFYFFRFWLKIF